MKARHLVHQAALLLVTDAFTYKPVSSFSSLSTSRKMTLISIPDAVAAHSNDGSIFIDGSWHMPNTRNAREEFRKGPRIGGARYFDIDTVW